MLAAAVPSGFAGRLADFGAGAGAAGLAVASRCAGATVVDLVYRATNGAFKPMPTDGSRPAELTTTTTVDGRAWPNTEPATAGNRGGSTCSMTSMSTAAS